MMRLAVILMLATLTACATQPPGEVAAIPGAAPLPAVRRIVLDDETRTGFYDQCLDGARAKQSEAVAKRYCGCVLVTAQTYVPSEEWTDAVLPGKVVRAKAIVAPISPTFAKVASACGVVVAGQIP